MAETPRSFKEYVADNAREYQLRIKTVSELGNKEMEMIERVLTKYVLHDITQPVKTIMQKHPLDFVDINNAEVWIVDVVTELPTSAYVLQQELKLALGLPEKYLVVRAVNDPLEIETQRMNSNDQIDMEAMEKGLSPAARLGTDSSYDDDELGELENPIYGDEYNSRFLEVVAKIVSEREKFLALPASGELNTGGTVADDEVQENNFNDTIYDQMEKPPQPVYPNYADTLSNLRKEGKIGEARLSTKGNYDDDEIKKTKKYDKYGMDGKVATVTITHTKEGIRKHK